MLLDDAKCDESDQFGVLVALVGRRLTAKSVLNTVVTCFAVSPKSMNSRRSASL